ncbi:MAG: hypothetical protein D4R68_03285 [Ignavibacteriales bacterium]|nr:MAG: hypothetical protein D4R68_03285 [Ignavibacteriales bacterium]
MKPNKFFFLIFLLAAFVLSQNTFAQSDREKVNNFDSRFKQYESAIKNAASLDECNIIGENIAKLKEEFAVSKTLLEKSLQINYDEEFLKIERTLEVRKNDFTQIVQLTTEVGSLKDKVSEISQQNEGLISQIKQLIIKTAKDAATIASLTKLVAQLKSNIEQRDELVRGIVDSLLQEFVKTPGTLNEAEKQAVYKKVDNGNLFYNIERTISDNVQFMKVTQMTADDLSKMKEQYIDFNKVWRQVGPKLAEVYLNRRDKAAQVANIDALFTDWNIRINDEMWGQVNKLFHDYKLALLPFKSGDQFVNSVTSFVDDEIKNYGVKSKTESESTFFAFTDSVYFKTVQPVWVPVLIESNLMTEANKDSVEKRIATWKQKVAPGSKMNWVYILGAIVIVGLVAAYFTKGKKKKVIVGEKKEEQS